MEYELGEIEKINPMYVRDAESGGSFSAGDVVLFSSSQVSQAGDGDTGRFAVAREDASGAGETVSVLTEGIVVAKKATGTTIEDGEPLVAGASGIVKPYAGGSTDNYDEVVGVAEEKDDSTNKIMIRVTE